MDYWRMAFVFTAACALAWSASRWHRTAKWDTERAFRRDMFFLFLLLLLGASGDAYRSRYFEGSQVFMVCTAFLIPVGVASLALAIRMTRAYGRSRQSSQQTSVARNRRGNSDH